MRTGLRWLVSVAMPSAEAKLCGTQIFGGTMRFALSEYFQRLVDWWENEHEMPGVD